LLVTVGIVPEQQAAFDDDIDSIHNFHIIERVAALALPGAMRSNLILRIKMTARNSAVSLNI